MGFLSPFGVVLPLTSTSPVTCLCLSLVQALTAGAQGTVEGTQAPTAFPFSLACDLNETDIPKTPPLSLSHKLTREGI